MVYNLFGKQSHVVTKEIIKILENDLMSSLSPHSLYQRFSMFPGNAPVPMLICGSDNDFVVDSNLLHGWQPWLKEGDIASATLRDVASATVRDVASATVRDVASATLRDVASATLGDVASATLTRCCIRNATRCCIRNATRSHMVMSWRPLLFSVFPFATGQRTNY